MNYSVTSRRGRYLRLVAVLLTVASTSCAPTATPAPLDLDGAREDALVRVDDLRFVASPARVKNQLQHATSLEEINNLLRIATEESADRENVFWQCVSTLPDVPGVWFAEAPEPDDPSTLVYYQVDLHPDGTATAEILGAAELFSPSPATDSAVLLAGLVDQPGEWNSDLDEVIADRRIPPDVQPTLSSTLSCGLPFRMSINTAPAEPSTLYRSTIGGVWLTVGKMTLAAQPDQ